MQVALYLVVDGRNGDLVRGSFATNAEASEVFYWEV